MKIQLISDLHLDFRPFTLKVNPQADVVVIAGDFGPIHQVVGRVTNLIQDLGDKETVIVLGNHDYYHEKLGEAINHWHGLFDWQENIHMLLDCGITIQGVRFAGGTLWSDFKLREPDLSQEQAMAYARRGINDFNLIAHDSGRILDPKDCVEMHGWTRSSIVEALEGDLPVVAVTHFMPTMKAISPYWLKMGAPLNPYFCSDCEDLVQPRLKAWLFGHTHTSADLKIGETRFVCNPRGYSADENRAFDSQLLIEV